MGSYYHNDKDADCNLAYSLMSWQDYSGSECGNQLVIAAEAEAKAGNNIVNFASSYVHACLTNKYKAGDNNDHRIPYYSFVPMVVDANFDGDQGNEAFNSVDSFIFNETDSQIILYGLVMNQTVSVMDIANNYSTCMIQVESFSEDDEGVPDTVFWTTRAFIYNGQLVLDGELNNYSNNFVNNGTGNYYFNKVNFTIDLKQVFTQYRINMNNVQIACYSDVGNLGIGTPPQYLPGGIQTNSIIKEQNKLLGESSDIIFIIETNPVINAIKVLVKCKKNFYAILTITNLQGEVIMELPQHEFIPGEEKLNIDVSNLKKGIYLLNFNLPENKVYSRKFFK